jgi:hypothetical protein
MTISNRYILLDITAPDQDGKRHILTDITLVKSVSIDDRSIAASISTGRTIDGSGPLGATAG